MTCESVKIVFVCSIIASASLENSVFLNLCKQFFVCMCVCVYLWKVLKCGACLHLGLFYSQVPKQWCPSVHYVTVN